MSEKREADSATDDKSGYKWMGIAASLAGVLVGAGTQYWITYQGIEKPKIEIEANRIALETKKASIEAHKLALALSPNVGTACKATNVDGFNWRVTCSSKNSGAYHVDVAIREVRVTLSSDMKEYLYEAGSGFAVNFPNNKQGFRASPGSEGDLWFYIEFDRNKYPHGIRRSDMTAKVTISYTTIASAQQYLIAQFPELQGIVGDSATRGTSIFVSLPPPRSETS